MSLLSVIRAGWMQRAVVALTLCLGMYGCSPVLVEKQRIESPDRKVDAVVVEKQTDATVSTPTEIFLVPRGSKPSGEPQLRGDRLEGLTVSWATPRLLVIKFTRGRIFNYTNFWQSTDVEKSSYVVEIRLLPENEGFAVPPLK